MHQFVQSAIDAANQGDNNKAMSFLKEVLATNPKDLDAWLVLAAVVDEPERKRQCLNRVLALDSTNKLAREELLDMDRSAMGGTPPFTLDPASVSEADEPQYKPLPLNSIGDRPATQPTPTQAQHISLNEWAEETPKAKSQVNPPSKPRAERPLVFKYSLAARVASYVFLALFIGFAFVVLIVLQNPIAAIIPSIFILLLLISISITSVQVSVSEKGIRVSQLFGLSSSEVGWNEITSIISNSIQRNLELVTKKGKSVKVTTQVTGYPTIVETMRQKRPDLFGMPATIPAPNNGFSHEYGSSPRQGNDIPNTTPRFSGTRTFKKNLFKQYGLFLIVVPLGLLAAWTTYSNPEYRMGAIITAIICFIMMLLPILQVSAVKVEPNKLTVETFIEQKDFSGKQIKEIKMESVRGRYGRVTHYVNIVTTQGRNYPLQGFSDGDELIYGILRQWWESYRNR